jgi:hypothetical protein
MKDDLTNEIKKRYEDLLKEEAEILKKIQLIKTQQKKYKAYLTAEGILTTPTRNRKGAVQQTTP